jgi:thiol-disulfide isomerase/thioredoxin
MKNMERNLRITATFLVFLILSCTSASNKSDKTQVESDSNSVAFKPNPLKLAEQEVKTMEIGSKAADFNLPDVSGKYYKLDDFKESRILVVIFTCNHCPTAQAYEDRIIQFVNDYKDKGVSVVAIMPNSPHALLLEECGYSDLDDTYESMIIRAKDKNFNFPYLYDGDTEEISIKYGPVATPHAFVFNANRELVYQGRLDASEKPGTGNAEDLRAAVNESLAGKAVSKPVNKTFGCSIKWAWKTEWKDKINIEWDAKPVTLDKISKNDIEKLIKNTSSKLRLINIWATWCGPCIIEFPELVKLQRMYGERSFEFISISADKPENTEKVLDFLTNRHASLKNYIFEEDDKYKLIEAIDPKWNGSLPYSMVVEPGGKIIYSVHGTVDLLALKKAIVENQLMQRYY